MRSPARGATRWACASSSSTRTTRWAASRAWRPSKRRGPSHRREPRRDDSPAGWERPRPRPLLFSPGMPGPGMEERREDAMLDLRVIREQPEMAERGLRLRGADLSVRAILEADAARRQLVAESEALKA